MDSQLPAMDSAWNTLPVLSVMLNVLIGNYVAMEAYTLLPAAESLLLV